MREQLLALMLAVVVILAVTGVAMLAPTGVTYLIAAGLVAAWSWLTLAEVDG